MLRTQCLELVQEPVAEQISGEEYFKAEPEELSDVAARLVTMYNTQREDDVRNVAAAVMGVGSDAVCLPPGDSAPLQLLNTARSFSLCMHSRLVAQLRARFVTARAIGLALCSFMLVHSPCCCDPAFFNCKVGTVLEHAVSACVRHLV